MWNFLWNFSGLDFWLPTRVASISSSFIATCSPRAPDLVNWRCCWLLIVVIDCRSYSWSKSCSSGWWSWTISCCGLDTVWQIMFLLTAVAAPLMRVWVLSKQLMEAGLFLLCNSSLTILLISSVVFTSTGTMLPTLSPCLDCPFWNESFTDLKILISRTRYSCLKFSNHPSLLIWRLRF